MLKRLLATLATAMLVMGLSATLWSASGGEAYAYPTGSAGMGTISVQELPPEARTTLQLIKKGGPFPYPKDGTVFGNREKRLPAKPRGYYKEYTVKTPGVATRGARRIVAGEGGEYYYTDDHYNTFKLIRE